MVEGNKQVAQVTGDCFETKAQAVGFMGSLAERYTRGEVELQNVTKAREAMLKKEDGGGWGGSLPPKEQRPAQCRLTCKEGASLYSCRCFAPKEEREDRGAEGRRETGIEQTRPPSPPPGPPPPLVPQEGFMILAASKIRSSDLERNSQAQALLHNVEVDAAWAWAQNTSFQTDVLTGRVAAEKPSRARPSAALAWLRCRRR